MPISQLIKEKRNKTQIARHLADNQQDGGQCNRLLNNL